MSLSNSEDRVPAVRGGWDGKVSTIRTTNETGSLSSCPRAMIYPTDNGPAMFKRYDTLSVLVSGTIPCKIRSRAIV